MLVEGKTGNVMHPESNIDDVALREVPRGLSMRERGCAGTTRDLLLKVQVDHARLASGSECAAVLFVFLSRMEENVDEI
jgi:hypothetical protein